MAGLDVLLGNMQQLKFFDFLFPFLLALAIFYGVLMFALGPKKDDAGKDKGGILPKSAISLIALVAAFFVMNYTGTVGGGISAYFSSLFGGGLIVASVILVIVILLGLTGFTLHGILGGDDDAKQKKKWIGLMVGIIVLVAVLIFFGSAGNAIPGLQGFNLDSNFWTIIVFVVILIAVFAFLGK